MFKANKFLLINLLRSLKLFKLPKRLRPSLMSRQFHKPVDPNRQQQLHHNHLFKSLKLTKHLNQILKQIKFHQQAKTNKQAHLKYNPLKQLLNLHQPLKLQIMSLFRKYRLITSMLIVFAILKIYASNVLKGFI